MWRTYAVNRLVSLNPRMKLSHAYLKFIGTSLCGYDVRISRRLNLSTTLITEGKKNNCFFMESE